MKFALFALIFSVAVISSGNAQAWLYCNPNYWIANNFQNIPYIALFGGAIKSSAQCDNMVGWANYIASYFPYLLKKPTCSAACTNGKICSTRPVYMSFQCGAGTGTGNSFPTTAAGFFSAISYSFLQTKAPAPLTAAPAGQCLCPMFNTTSTTGDFGTNIANLISQIKSGAYSTSTGIIDAINPTSGQCQLLSQCPTNTFSVY